MSEEQETILLSSLRGIDRRTAKERLQDQLIASLRREIRELRKGERPEEEGE